MFFHMHSPFVFCKGPYLTSQHRYRVKSFSAAHTQPCFLLAPLLQRLPNAAIVCQALGRCLCVHWERPAAGSSTSPGPHGQTGRQTPSYRVAAQTHCYPASTILQKGPTAQSSCPTLPDTTGLRVRAHQKGPTAQSTGSKQEHRAGEQNSAKMSPLSAPPFCSAHAIFEVSHIYVTLKYWKKKNKTWIILPSKSSGGHLCCRHQRLP